MVTPESLTLPKKILKRYCCGVPIVDLQTFPIGWIDRKWEVFPLEGGPTKGVVFSAIGNPASFLHALRDLGFATIEHFQFPDHHRFSENNLAELFRTAKRRNLPLICSEKDLVKIPSDYLPEFPVFSLRIEMKPREGDFLVSGLIEG